MCKRPILLLLLLYTKQLKRPNDLPLHATVEKYINNVYEICILQS